MIVTTTDSVPGREVSEVMGVVRGSFMFGAATILSSFTDEHTVMRMVDQVAECQERAMKHLREKAEGVGADAVIGIRLSSATYEFDNQLKYQVSAYGTAVKLA